MCVRHRRTRCLVFTVSSVRFPRTVSGFQGSRRRPPRALPRRCLPAARGSILGAPAPLVNTRFREFLGCVGAGTLGARGGGHGGAAAIGILTIALTGIQATERSHVDSAHLCASSCTSLFLQFTRGRHSVPRSSRHASFHIQNTRGFHPPHPVLCGSRGNPSTAASCPRPPNAPSVLYLASRRPTEGIRINGSLSACSLPLYQPART